MEEDILNRNKNINRGFRKLEVWNEAIDLYAFVKLNILISSKISFRVKDQIEGSVFSVHSNIAEGYGRRYLKENIQFNSIALASLAENYSQIYALRKVQLINEELFDEYDKKHYSLENKLINYNKSQVKQLKEKSDWHNDYIVREIIETYGIED
ncbi:four helix bundle protein [Lentimicrobium saccharophilum]|nr:four helix bundle protein [Lentimicrobium saccharophilum]